MTNILRIGSCERTRCEEGRYLLSPQKWKRVQEPSALIFFISLWTHPAVISKRLESVNLCHVKWPFSYLHLRMTFSYTWILYSLSCNPFTIQFSLGKRWPIYCFLGSKRPLQITRFVRPCPCFQGMLMSARSVRATVLPSPSHGRYFHLIRPPRLSSCAPGNATWAH